MGSINIFKNFVRAISNYLGRADESGLDITGDLTLGAWVYFDAESTGVATGIISKWYETGNQRAYVLYKNANDEFVFSVSDDGSTVYTITDGGVNYVVNQWFYIVGRFTELGEELALFVNGMWYRNTTGLPDALYNSSEAFEIGRYNRDNYLDGRVSQAFICAYSVPDNFVCVMFGHGKALYMNIQSYAYPCSSTSSSTSSSSSSTTSSSSSYSAPP